MNITTAVRTLLRSTKLGNALVEWGWPIWDIPAKQQRKRLPTILRLRLWGMQR